MLTRREPDAPPRFLDLPLSAEPNHGTRNLVAGVAMLAIAAIGFWMGLYYAGAAAARVLIACLLTFGVTWLLLHSKVLRQRNGVLFAVGLVALLGAAMPFVEGGFRKLDNVARERLAGETPSAVAALSVPPPPPTLATAPPAPPTIPLPADAAIGGADADLQSAPEPAAEVKRATAAAKPKKAPLQTKPVPGDDVARELIVPEPAEGSGKLIRVKEDVKVDLDGRPTIIRAGTIAPFKELNDGIVTFLAGDHEIQVEMDHVTFTGASKEKPEDITRLAQQEAMLRYPKLAEPDSRENILYVTRVKEAQLDPEMKELFFKDPRWPLVLAEELAKSEKWLRADLPPAEGAEAAGAETGAAPGNAAPAEPSEAPAGEIPANQLPANQLPANDLPAKKDSEPLLPPNAPPIPQQAEPPPAKAK